jgi:hypothetical protein
MKDTHESSDRAPYRPASSGVQATAYGGPSPNDLSNALVVWRWPSAESYPRD